MKKNILITVLIILVLLFGGYFVWDVLQNNNNTNNTSENTNVDLTSNTNIKTNMNKYSYDENQKGDIIFYKDGKKVSEYNCSGKSCYLSQFDYEYDYDGSGGKVLIVGDKVLISVCDGKTCDWIDGYGGASFAYENETNEVPYGTVILYDIITGEEKKFNNVKGISYAGKYMKVLKYTDETYEVVSYDGTISRKFDKDALVFSCYEGCQLDDFDYAKDLLVFKSNGKYGIQKISDGTVVLKNSFEKIEFFDDITFIIDDENSVQEKNKYFIAKKDGLFNLYDITNMKQITKNGYDRIWILYDDVMLVYKDKELSFKYMDESYVIEDKIHVNNLVGFMPRYETGVRVLIYKNTGIIKLFINDGNDEFDYQELQYEFNMKTKSLTKIN